MFKKPIVKKTFTPGENLFEEGEMGTEAYLIKSGLVSIWRTEGTQRVSLATRGEGEIVGEMALIDDTVRSATVTAQSRVTAEVITKQELDAMLSEAPQELQMILYQLFESLRTANDLIGMYASRPTSQT